MFLIEDDDFVVMNLVAFSSFELSISFLFIFFV